MNQMCDPDENRAMLTIDLKKNRLRVHKPVLKMLGSPPFVELLFSTRRGAIVILKCEKRIPGGKEIPVLFDKPANSGTFNIYSKELLTRIRTEFSGLDQNGIYHLSGVAVSGEDGICFPLSTLRSMEASDVQAPD